MSPSQASPNASAPGRLALVLAASVLFWSLFASRGSCRRCRARSRRRNRRSRPRAARCCTAARRGGGRERRAAGDGRRDGGMVQSGVGQAPRTGCSSGSALGCEVRRRRRRPRRAVGFGRRQLLRAIGRWRRREGRFGRRREGGGGGEGEGGLALTAGHEDGRHHRCRREQREAEGYRRVDRARWRMGMLQRMESCYACGRGFTIGQVRAASRSGWAWGARAVGCEIRIAFAGVIRHTARMNVAAAAPLTPPHPARLR